MEGNILKCPCGLHGRTAIGLHQLADSLHCLVLIEKMDVGRSVNCSSLLGILSLGVETGDEIKINIINGDKEMNYKKIADFLNEHI